VTLAAGYIRSNRHSLTLFDPRYIPARLDNHPRYFMSDDRRRFDTRIAKLTDSKIGAADRDRLDS
jgi:hypothetical protein